MTRWVAFIAVTVLIYKIDPPWSRAQSTPASDARFDVASVKLNTRGGIRQGDTIALTFLKRVASGSRDGRFRAEGTPLSVPIQLAYNVRDFQVLGEPSWTNSDGYDIIARADGNATFEQMRPRLRSLLADRFKLALRRETREMPIYELTAAKGGLKIVAAKAGNCVTPDPDNPPPPPSPIRPPIRFCGGIVRRMNSIDATAISMPELIDLLSDELARTVVDKTGFADKFDFHLEFTHDALADSTEPDPSIFAALQDQLGLRLESAKGLVEVLVIDHVERPSAN